MQAIYLKNSYLDHLVVKPLKIKQNKVIVSDSIIYPGGGGQKMDHAWLIIDGQQDKVLKVSRDQNSNFVLTLADPIKNLNATEVTEKIDFAYRKQNMRYHTLLHLLSAYLFRKYGAKVTSSAIEDDHARLEIQFPPDDVPKQFDKELITKNMHELIEKDMPVSSEIVDRSSLSDERLIRTYTNLIPKQITRIRLVKIDNYDEQACGGTHVKSTAEIGKFKFTALKNHGHLRKRIKVALL